MVTPVRAKVALVAWAHYPCMYPYSADARRRVPARHPMMAVFSDLQTDCAPNVAALYVPTRTTQPRKAGSNKHRTTKPPPPRHSSAAVAAPTPWPNKKPCEAENLHDPWSPRFLLFSPLSLVCLPYPGSALLRLPYSSLFAANQSEQSTPADMCVSTRRRRLYH